MGARFLLLGCVLSEMLTGLSPRGANAQAALMAHVTQTPPPLSAARGDVLSQLTALVGRCLEMDREDRWQSATELLGALEALVTPAGGVTPGRLETIVPPAPAPPVLVLAIAVALLAATSVWVRPGYITARALGEGAGYSSSNSWRLGD
jgi:serine/threonine protein kinase